MDFKEALSVFFGLTERTRKSNMDDLTKQLKDAYARVKELQETLYTLKNSTSSDSDVNNFVIKATQVNYPFLSLDIINSVPPVTMRVAVGNTSFFYSDTFDGHEDPLMVYADAPIHNYSLEVSRTLGLVNLTKHTEPPFYWNGYDISEDHNFTTDNPYGHPHANGSQDRESVQATGNTLCFGNNRGVPDLLKSASTITDVGMLMRKLYYWLTEIFLGSVYHNNVSPIRIASGEVFDEMVEVSDFIFNDYRTIIPGVRDYFKAHAEDLASDYISSVAEPMQKLLNKLLEFFAQKPRLLGRCFSNMHDFVGSGKLIPSRVMCLYQFITACVLIDTVGLHTLSPAVVNAIGSDLFYLPSAWYAHKYTFASERVEQLCYPKYFLHYFDGFKYAVDGGY